MGTAAAVITGNTTQGMLTSYPDPNPTSSTIITRGGRDPYAATPQDTKRLHEMATAWNAYNGIFRGGDEQWPLVWVKGEEPNPNVIVNRCGPAVDTDVAWLFGQSVSISAPKGPKEAQQYLDEAWGVDSEDSSDDDKMALLQDLAVNGAVTGHAFLKIVWDSESDQEYPQLVVLDSQMVRVQTDPHNRKIPVCYIIEYEMPDPLSSSDGAMGTFRQVIRRLDPDGKYHTTGLPDDDTTWEIQDYWRRAGGSAFLPVHPDGSLCPPQPWSYSWPPIEDCPHLSQPNAYWGKPRLSHDAIRTNEAICTQASNINKLALYHGHPITYTIKTGSNQRALRHKPGTILEVSSDIKSVEGFADLQHLMDVEQDFRADFDELVHVPAQAFGRLQDVAKLPTSGIAIKLGYLTLIADVMKERRTYGMLIRRVSQHMLELKQKEWGTLSIALGWQDMMPTDDQATAQLVSTAKQAGMSDHYLCELLEVDYEQELQYRQDEQKEAMRAAMQGQSAAAAMMPSAAAMPRGANGAGASGQPGGEGPGQPSAPGAAAQQKAPPVNSPAAVRQRQVMQASAGKKPTANGM